MKGCAYFLLPSVAQPPRPLHSLWPLHAFFSVLQPPLPLQEFCPLQACFSIWVSLAAALSVFACACVVAAEKPMVKRPASAATASLFECDDIRCSPCLIECTRKTIHAAYPFIREHHTFSYKKKWRHCCPHFQFSDKPLGLYLVLSWLFSWLHCCCWCRSCSWRCFLVFLGVLWLYNLLA